MTEIDFSNPQWILLALLLLGQVLVLAFVVLGFKRRKLFENDYQSLQAEQQAATRVLLYELEQQLEQVIREGQGETEQKFSLRLDRVQRMMMKAMMDNKSAQQAVFEQLLKAQLQQANKQRQHEKENAQWLYRQAQQQSAELSENLSSLQVKLLKELQLGVDKQSQQMERYLDRLTGAVEARLNEGFEKSTKTFTAIIERLSMIDAAQQKITELSTSVVSLHDILNDKRSRGAFGEVQLKQLITNVLPSKTFAFQHTLSNRRVVDCMLFLPEPTGNMGIDAKFPLENYKKMLDDSQGKAELSLARRQFKADIKKHVNDIADKYIIPKQTANGAIMFIPAEAVFAEIHASHPDLVEYAHKKRVWLASPTTLMAILTTASAVVKDEATRKQVHIIQEHLGLLAQDFGRFQKRVDSLSANMGKVNQGVKDIALSATKISSRFTQIESADIEALGAPPPATPAIAPAPTTDKSVELEPSS